MSELMQLLIGAKPHPIPVGMARIATFEIPEDEVEVFYCPHCRRDDLDETDFYTRSDGRYSSWCKVCTRANSRRNRTIRKGSTCTFRYFSLRSEGFSAHAAAALSPDRGDKVVGILSLLAIVWLLWDSIDPLLWMAINFISAP